MNGFFEMLEDTNNKGYEVSKIETIIFEIIFKHIKDMIYIMKVEKGPIFRYIFANEEGFKHAKLPLDYLGKSFEEVVPSILYEKLQKEYSQVYDSKIMHRYSDEVMTKEGIKQYCESVLTPITDENGKVKYIISVTRDNTKSLEEKRLLAESEQKYRSIIDNNLDAILSVDLNGFIYGVNPAGEQLTGYKFQETHQVTVHELIDHLFEESDVAAFQNHLRKCKVTNSSQSLDCLLKIRNQELNIHIKITPINVDGSVRGMYIIMRDMSEKTKTAEKIRYMAFHDQLTGLYNRRALLEDLNIEIKKATTTKMDFALLTIDIDRFKYINDTFGHIVGDQILIKVAERLLEFNKENCHVYRQGGDEFNILLSHTTRQETSKFAQSILARFATSFYLNSQEYYITPSIGISMYPIDGRNEETLIKNSDEALFRVKERGKAHFQFYRPDMNMPNITPTNIVSLETNLRKALKNNELTLYYQPQISLRDETIQSFEALIRWESPTLGFISPGEFIPLAEDTGLIIPIGNWVIETACKQILNWKEQFDKDVRIAINISPKQFQQPTFVEIIKTTIMKYAINPSMLEIEITEGAMQNTMDAIPVLRKLKNIGVIISIDDFGTGYSSLNYLKQFPIDVLKIDQSFVKDLLQNDKDAAIITSIIHLGHSLGMEVIAEGVENKEQKDFLVNANCQKAQGFYYSKPLPIDKIQEFF